MGYCARGVSARRRRRGKHVGAGKKLIDVKHQAFRAVSAVKNKAAAYFREPQRNHRAALGRAVNKGKPSSSHSIRVGSSNISLIGFPKLS